MSGKDPIEGLGFFVDGFDCVVDAPCRHVAFCEHLMFIKKKTTHTHTKYHLFFCFPGSSSPILVFSFEWIL